MGRLVLTDDLLTGIDEIDEQHRSMFAWADRILNEDPGQPSIFPARAMTFLAGYVEFHFAAEEFAMEVFGYHDKLRHKILHDGLRHEFEAVRGAVAAVGLTRELRVRIQFLFEEWLRRHIQEADRKLVLHLNATPREDNAPVLPDPKILRNAGVEIPSDIDLHRVHVVAVPGLMSEAEVKARTRGR